MTENIYLDFLSGVPGNEHYKNRLIRILCGLIEVAPEKKQRGFHSHHIIPKSWKPEWDKIKENRVLLSPKAHYVVHHLMWKAYPNDWKMMKAFHRMYNSKEKQRITGRVYKQMMMDFSVHQSKNVRGEKNGMWGRQQTDKQKLATSKANTGLVRSDESKLKNRLAHLGKSTSTDKHKQATSKANTGTVSCLDIQTGIYTRISREEYYANKARYKHNGRKGAGKIYCLDIMENTLTCVSKEVYYTNKDRYFHSNTKIYKEWRCKILKI